MLLWQRALHII